MEIIETRTQITIKTEAGEVVDLLSLTPPGTKLESIKPLIAPVGLIFYLEKRYGLNYYER
jgi:hypothetical protein